MFLDLDLCDPDASAGLMINDWAEDAVEVLSQSFAGAIGQNIGFEKVTLPLQEGVFAGIIFIKKAGVVEVFLDPGLEALEIAEINDESVGVGLVTGESQRDRPVVPVDVGAMTCMEVLSVGERDIAVGFFTGEHGRG